MKLLPLKPFQETLHAGMCGPASLKMILDFYGVEKSESDLAKLCEVDADLGTSAKKIKEVAESLGFLVEIKENSSFDDIQSWLDKEIPVIVNWFSRGRTNYDESEVPDGHYSVVVGLDEKNIYLEDPEIGNLRTISRDDFHRVWFDFEGQAINSWEDMIVRQLIAIYR